MRVLVVEDEPLIADGIQVILKQEGYAVDVMANGLHAFDALMSETFDLMILDIGLPGLSGFELLSKLRKSTGFNKETPVLILTARDAIDDRILGLDQGADDYMVKPFDIYELIARVRALLRRSKGRANNVIQYDEIEVDPASHHVTYKQQPVKLRPREFAVLVTLLENQGKVVSKNKLEESIYAWNNEVESNALEVHIHHLRKKLFSSLIKTIRGVGYIVP
ncbi:MAG: response regulator transcription factor [gamma proteobacterium symbiont of Taylorina sp.]|nr:response regulator transcription factor [gamma proteobacterium symbiont of Taylorina sp.]